MEAIRTLEYKNKTYKVVRFRHNNKTSFGTISTEDIEKSVLTRTLNGLELMMADSVKGAIVNRKAYLDQKEDIENFLKVYEHKEFDLQNEEIRNNYIEYIKNK